jgi:hypothetical protein
MKRRSVALQYIQDDEARKVGRPVPAAPGQRGPHDPARGPALSLPRLPASQVAFAKKKAALMRRATELAVLCNAQVALVMFDDKGKLTQFSTAEMDAILEQYGQAVLELHERYTPHDVRARGGAAGWGWRVLGAACGGGQLGRRAAAGTASDAAWPLVALPQG